MAGGGRVLGWLRSVWSRRAGNRDATGGGVVGAIDEDGLLGPEADYLVPFGPYDVDETPSDGVRRLDLGCLLVPVVDGVDYLLRLDAAPARTGQARRVTAVLARAGQSAMELTALAAPKSHGIWDDIRAELCLAATRQRLAPGPGLAPVPGLAHSPGLAPAPAPAPVVPVPDPAGGAVWPAVGDGAGTPAWPSDACPAGPVEVTVGRGRFGPELRLEPMSSGAAGGGPVRLLGIDGPRWLLRAAIIGPAAAGRADSLLDDVLRGTIVIRGGRAMPVRAPLPLRLPTDTEDPAGPDDLVDPADVLNPDGPPAGRTSARARALPTNLDSLCTRPTGTGSADPRRVSYQVVSQPFGGLSRNLSTWG